MRRKRLKNNALKYSQLFILGTASILLVMISSVLAVNGSGI